MSWLLWQVVVGSRERSNPSIDMAFVAPIIIGPPVEGRGATNVVFTWLIHRLARVAPAAARKTTIVTTSTRKIV
jgi:hypothetical protein